MYYAPNLCKALIYDCDTSAYLYLHFCVSLRLGKMELVYVLLQYLYVYLACVTFLSFSLPLGVGGRLRIVIVALLGPFI